MEVVKTVQRMKALSQEARERGETIVLVPTMGFFHEGHLSLIREGRKRGDLLVVSLFVNPTQFGPSEDYETYPRDFERDFRMAKEASVDILFCPEVEEMYPPGHQTVVRVTEVTQGLCGKSRPTHFQGVTTVVLMLFEIVRPHVAIFGEKDFQQLVTIRQMVRDLHVDVEIVGMPTVRETDGLAMSSRNVRLQPAERKAALSLYRALMEAEGLVRRGEREANRIRDAMNRIFQAEPLVRLDYLEICDAHSLREVSRLQGDVVIAVAAHVGGVRLIDNFVFRGLSDGPA